ncbi:hypothetical protein TB2_037557 [Malus domestica]
MEDLREILLKSLESFDVCVPDDVSFVKDLMPATSVSICGQSLNLIDITTPFPTFLPDSSVVDQFKLCTDIASGIKSLGYLADLSFHQRAYAKKLVQRVSMMKEKKRRCRNLDFLWYARLSRSKGNLDSETKKSSRSVSGSDVPRKKPSKGPNAVLMAHEAFYVRNKMVVKDGYNKRRSFDLLPLFLRKGCGSKSTAPSYSLQLPPFPDPCFREN